MKVKGRIVQATPGVHSQAKLAFKQLKIDAKDAFKGSHAAMKILRELIEADQEGWRGDEDARAFLQEFDSWPDTLLSATDDIRDDDLEEALAGLSRNR